MLKVRDLVEGDTIKHPTSGIPLVVTNHEENKVMVKKPEASIHSVMSIGYYSPKFDDCENRVELVRN